MKRKTPLLFFVVILGLFFVYWLISGVFQKRAPAQERAQHIKNDRASYFFPIAVENFTQANQPCLSIHINGIPVTATLDLGFRGQLACSPGLIAHLEQKKHIGTQKMYGATGGEYEEHLYEVESVEIGPVVFSSPILHEEDRRFHEDATLKKESHTFSVPPLSKVGWELFGNTNLFLDLKNSKIGFCDSLETLEREGYATSEFVKTPLLLERGLVEFEAETEKGLLRCMLDTGSTWNIINTDCKEQLSETQAISGGADLWNCVSFSIHNQNLNPISFHRYLIKMPIQIDAILGMEFFQSRLVFLDFSEKYVYFSRGDQVRNGKDGRHGENGEDGPNGGNGGNGRAGWLRGGNGGNGGNAVDSTDSTADTIR